VLERGKLISPKDDGSMMIEARGVSKHYGQLQDPVTEVRIALGPPASPMEPELSEEAKPRGGDREGSESRAVEADEESRSAPDAVRSPEVDETRVLRIALKPGESGQDLLARPGLGRRRGSRPAEHPAAPGRERRGIPSLKKRAARTATARNLVRTRPEDGELPSLSGHVSIPRSELHTEGITRPEGRSDGRLRGRR
jgi:hypothetical protein